MRSAALLVATLGVAVTVAGCGGKDDSQSTDHWAVKVVGQHGQVSSCDMQTDGFEHEAGKLKIVGKNEGTEPIDLAIVGADGKVVTSFAKVQPGAEQEQDVELASGTYTGRCVAGGKTLDTRNGVVPDFTVK